MITKTTMNMCGTLGPYGIAVTVSRRLLEERLVVHQAEGVGDAQSE